MKTDGYNVLSDFDNDNNSRNDGLTTELYETFWPILSDLLLRCLNYSHKYGLRTTNITETSSHRSYREKGSRQASNKKLEPNFIDQCVCQDSN